MVKIMDIAVDDKLQSKSYMFKKKIVSDMYYEANLNGEDMSFEWVDEVEFACPYLDNIVKNPKVALIKEEDVVKIEKAKKISVASVKDLSKHTHYIEKINENNEVQPAKILIQRHEETYNTYENRFIYTLIYNLTNFVLKKEKQLDDLQSKDDKILEYAASTNTFGEKVNIELKITSKEMPQGKDEETLKNEISKLKKRIKKIKDYLGIWKKSVYITSLEKAHVAFIIPPIKKTNMILKNPNFQIAMKLWGYLQTYDFQDNNDTKEGLDTEGDNVLKGLLDDAFQMNYFVLDSIRASKREEKELLSKYALIILNEQIQKAVTLLLNSKIKITEEQILSMITEAVNNAKSKRLVGSTDVKNKFKSTIDEYLEKTQD